MVANGYDDNIGHAIDSGHADDSLTRTPPSYMQWHAHLPSNETDNAQV